MGRFVGVDTVTNVSGSQGQILYTARIFTFTLMQTYKIWQVTNLTVGRLWRLTHPNPLTETPGGAFLASDV